MTALAPTRLCSLACVGEGRNRAPSWADWIAADVPAESSAAGGRVLLVSYEFPPTGGSGVQRPAKLTKYLRQLGWQVEVLAAGHERFAWHDASLLEGIPSDTWIHRVAGLEPACIARRLGSIFDMAARGRLWAYVADNLGASNPIRSLGRNALASTGETVGGDQGGSAWFEDRIYWRLVNLTARLGLGNGERLWLGPAVRAALRRHRQMRFDAVISTGPPHFTHQVALRFSKAADVPWLADLRDPLVSDFTRGATPSASGRSGRRLERTILGHADAVITTCRALAGDLRERYPARPPDSIRAITNGFDSDDLRSLIGESPPALRGAETPAGATGPTVSDCVFVAAGSLYGRREIDKLVDPLARTLTEHPEWQGRVRLVLAGSIDAAQRRRWEHDRPAWLSLAGYLDHQAALRLCASAACNIVMVPECRHGRLSVPGKTFELLALPTHILALAPEDGDTADIVRSAGAATIAPLERAERVHLAFNQIIADYFAGQLARERDWPGVERYSRRAVAVQFAECLEVIRRSRA